MTAASAPGKLFLCGEYAVLEGGAAVVASIDRRAIATVTEDARAPSPVVAAVVREVLEFLHAMRAAPVERVPRVAVDTRGFSRGGAKMGLGSSGAVAASCTAALFEWAGLHIEAHREQILAVATKAHRAAQGQVGSGADVAASVLGGTIRFSMGRPPVALARSLAPHVVVWTGRAASTADLVAAVGRFSRSDPAAFTSLLEEMRALAASVADLFAAGATSDLARGYRDYGSLMERLGRGAGVPIVTPAHAAIRAAASDFGGGAKPSGAGGGDVAVAVFDEPEAAGRFAKRCEHEGFMVLDVKLHGDAARRV